MKVLHVNAGNEDGGGLTYIINLMKIMREGGQDARLLVLTEGPVAQAAREENLPVTVIQQNGKFDLSILKKIKNFVQMSNFDVVHTHGPRANLYLRMIKSQLPKQLWVTTVHSNPKLDFMNKGIKGKIQETLNLSSINKADGIFAVSKRFKNELAEQFDTNPANIRVAELGIPLDSERPLKEEHKTFTLTIVARLEPVKNHLMLFNALKESGITDFRLNVVGDGSLKNKLVNWTIDNGLQQQISFQGFMDHAEINKLYRKTDFGILSSDSEGFALVLVEAASQHVPLISTDVGAARDIIKNEMSGFIVPAGDEQAMASAIIAAKEAYNEHLVDKMGYNIFKNVEDEFSTRSTFRKIVEGYEHFAQAKEQKLILE